MLKNAVDFSKQKYEGKLIPYYYIESSEVNKINFMLPLSLEYDNEPDCVILFDKEGKAHTLLNMAEAYTDLRILGKLDDYDWLSHSGSQKP